MKKERTSFRSAVFCIYKREEIAVCLSRRDEF